MKRNELKKQTMLYLTALPSLSRSTATIKKYAYVLGNFTGFVEKSEKAAIDTALVIKWREALHSSGVKQNTLRDYLTCLQAFFAWHSDMTGEENPIARKQKPKPEPVQYELLDGEDVAKIMSYSPKKRYENFDRNRAIVLLLIQSGLRADELLSLKPSDLDFENSTVLVERGKGDKKRYAPFPKEAQEAVAKYLNSDRPKYLTAEQLLIGTEADKSGHITARWHKMSSQNLNLIVKRYVKLATGKVVHTHMLRHAAASIWDAKGVPLRVISSALGHSTSTITEKVYISPLREAQAATTINAYY